jgi:hypothetical protein
MACTLRGSTRNDGKRHDSPPRHCEERSDAAIHGCRQMDCFVAFGSSQ